MALASRNGTTLFSSLLLILVLFLFIFAATTCAVPTNSNYNADDLDTPSFVDIIEEDSTPPYEFDLSPYGLNGISILSPLDQIYKECEGQLQCWLNQLVFTLPEIPYEIAGVVGNMSNFRCSQINVDNISSGTNPPPYPDALALAEIHMGVVNAGLECTGKFYYNVTFIPNFQDTTDFKAIVNDTNLKLQLYVLSQDGQMASGTLQGDCEATTHIDLEFSGSATAFVLDLVKKPLIDMMTNLIQDNFCLLTRDLINVTMSDIIHQITDTLAPALEPHKPLPPVTSEAFDKSIPFASLTFFRFLDRLFNGDAQSSGIFSNPDPINCIVGLFTDHTGNLTIPTYNFSDPTSFMPNITFTIPDLALNISLGLPSITLTNLNTIQSLKLLHAEPNSDFDVQNGVSLSRLKAVFNTSLVITPLEHCTITQLPLQENFIFLVDMLQPHLALDLRVAVDKARLAVTKLGAFCSDGGLFPCLLSLFDSTWKGNGGLRLALLGLQAKFALAVLPLPPSDSSLERDLDTLLNNVVMLISQKFGAYFSRVVYGGLDNIARIALNDLIESAAIQSPDQCTAHNPDWDGTSVDNLVWRRSIISKFFQWITHDILHGVDGLNDFIQCAWTGGSVGPDHDFDRIDIPDQKDVVASWEHHFEEFSKKFNFSNAPLLESFNNTMRGLDSVYRFDILRPGKENETCSDPDYTMFGEFGLGDSGNYTFLSDALPALPNISEQQLSSLSTLPPFSTEKFEMLTEDFMSTAYESIFGLLSPSNIPNLSHNERIELYNSFMSNIIASRERITKLVNTVEQLQDKLTNPDSQKLHTSSFNTTLVSSTDDIQQLLYKFVMDTSNLSQHLTDEQVQLLFDIKTTPSTYISRNDSNEDDLDQQQFKSQPATNDLLERFLRITDHLQTVLPSSHVSTTTSHYNLATPSDELSNELRWSFVQDDPEPESPPGPLKVWLALGIPLARRYIIVNTTIVIDSFDIDGSFVLLINKNKLYDLTISKAFSLCLPSVFESYHFDTFNGHVHALTLVLDALLDPRAKLFHQHRTGQDFVNDLNKSLVEDALPLIKNVTTMLFDTLVWASTYSCKGEAIPGAPKVVDNLKHDIVEWLAIIIPSSIFSAFILWSILLLVSKQGTKNWSNVFCRSGRGSHRGHVVLSSTKTRHEAKAIEDRLVETRSRVQESNNDYSAVAGPRLISSNHSIVVTTNTSANDISTSSSSLPLNSASTGFIDEYNSLQLPQDPKYGTINPTPNASLNSTSSHDASIGSYKPPTLSDSIDSTTPHPLSATLTPISTPTRPGSSDSSSSKHELINLNTLALESGISIDSLTGSSLLHSPTLPLLARLLIVVLILVNALLFLVSNMSNGAAVTLILSFFGTPYDFGTIFNFTLISTIEDMWTARVYVLFVLIGAFSGFLPYFKLFLILLCWVLPQHKLSVKHREFILVWTDRFGKWSLLDAFVFVLMFVAFRMHLPVFGENLIVDSIVRSDPGFYFFLLATMMSLCLSHIILAVHRHVLTPYVIEKGGPVRSVTQHYHTLFVIDQTSECYNKEQETLLMQLPDCEEYQELMDQRKDSRLAEEQRYKESLAKLGYTNVNVTSIDTMNLNQNQNHHLTTTSSSLSASPSNLSTFSVFDEVNPITGELISSKSSFRVDSPTTLSPLHTHQQYAVKLRFSKAGSALIVLLLLAGFGFLLYGSYVDTFSFQFGGISGWLLGSEYDTNSWSILRVGANIASSSRDPSSFGIRWIQVTYYIFAFVIPLFFLILSIALFVIPFTLRAHKTLHVLVEILFAWCGVDVFIVSILAAVLQISQLAESLVGDRCDFILPFLQDYMHDVLNGYDKCFVVIAHYKAGALYMVLAAVFIIFTGIAGMTLSSSALADRAGKYYRLIQYALYNRQKKQRQASLSQDDAGILNQDDDELLLLSQITEYNHQHPDIINAIHAIREKQNLHNYTQHIPVWYGFVQFLHKIGLVHLSRQTVIEDIFGFKRIEPTSSDDETPFSLNSPKSRSPTSEKPKSPLESDPEIYTWDQNKLNNAIAESSVLDAIQDDEHHHEQSTSRTSQSHIYPQDYEPEPI